MLALPDKWDNRADKLSEKQQKDIASDIRSKMDLPDKSGDLEFENMNESELDFIVRERWISKQDPCPCGGGKRFGDCHWEEVTKGDKSS